jgi:hypothetical protein
LLGHLLEQLEVGGGDGPHVAERIAHRDELAGGKALGDVVDGEPGPRVRGWVHPAIPNGTAGLAELFAGLFRQFPDLTVERKDVVQDVPETSATDNTTF